MSSPARDLAGKRALVMGLGSFGGGTGTVRFLCAAGARVTVTDLRGPELLAEGLEAIRDLPVALVLGEHRELDFRSADLVIANPAVRPEDPHLVAARAAGARVVSAVELFLERARARLCCITGTQGKSSTTSMVAQLLAHAGFRTRLGGNIGGSLLPEVDSIGHEEVCVLELSSYQLEALSLDRVGRAEVVAVTNVLADHLERHGTAREYARAKARILELLDARGTALLPADTALLGDFEEFRDACRGRELRFGAGAELRVEDGAFRLGTEVLGAARDLALPGDFQVDNALVALGAARLLGAEPARLAAALPHLRGLPHRLEDLGVVRGHRVWDNGVSTTPDSTASALESIARPCVLVCGGQEKRDLSFAPLVAAARGRVSRAFVFGRAAAALEAALAEADVPTLPFKDVVSAATAAIREAEAGNSVLFSPACASFDAFPNFQVRARAFRAAVDALR